jgi:hypothetical protein
MSQLMEMTEIKGMTIDEKQRELFRTSAAQIEAQAAKVMAQVKEAKTVEELNDAVAWCNEKKDMIRNIEEGDLGMARAFWHKKWFDQNEEIKKFITPLKTWKDNVMALVTRKRADIAFKLKQEEERKNAKLLAKAEEKHEQKIQTLMDLDKPKAAMIAAKKPVAFTPVKIEMPKIKGAVWKKTYIVTIEDIGAVLTYIAKTPRYHTLIDQEKLTGRLESLARDLAGNMGEFKGIKCFESENHALGGNK